MKEGDFNRQVQQLIEAEGGYVVKTIASNRSGTHDMLACIYGCFVSLEGKVKGNTESYLQSIHAKRVIDAGGIAEVVDTLEDVKHVIQIAKIRGADNLPYQPRRKTKQLDSIQL